MAYFVTLDQEKLDQITRYNTVHIASSFHHYIGEKMNVVNHHNEHLFIAEVTYINDDLADNIEIKIIDKDNDKN